MGEIALLFLLLIASICLFAMVIFGVVWLVLKVISRGLNEKRTKGWLVVENGYEYLYFEKPHRVTSIYGWDSEDGLCEHLPKGTIRNLIGRELTWADEPVELKEE